MLRINTKKGDEFRIWLTRRFAGLLLNQLSKEMDKYGGEPTVASSPEIKQMFKDGSMEKRYEYDKIVNFPLGEPGILAFGMKFKSDADNILVLEIPPENGQGITLNLNKSMLFMFCNLLTQGCSQATWRLLDDDQSQMRVH